MSEKNLVAGCPAMEIKPLPAARSGSSGTSAQPPLCGANNPQRSSLFEEYLSATWALPGQKWEGRRQGGAPAFFAAF